MTIRSYLQAAIAEAFLSGIRCAYVYHSLIVVPRFAPRLSLIILDSTLMQCTFTYHPMRTA